MATKINAADVINFIWSGDCSVTDRKRIIEALNEQRKHASATAAIQFVPGDKAQFTSKYGSVVKGSVTKVNRMTIHVQQDGGGRWRVSPQFLQRQIG